MFEKTIGLSFGINFIVQILFQYITNIRTCGNGIVVFVIFCIMMISGPSLSWGLTTKLLMTFP